MTSVPVLADRVMRARWESTCPACGGVIHVTNPIARCPGRLWFHLSCFLGHQHNTDSGKCAPKGNDVAS